MSAHRVVIDVPAGDGRIARDLDAGGVFAPGCELPIDEPCELLVRTGRGELVVAARVVFVAPGTGAGLELVGFGPELRGQLSALLEPAAPSAPVVAAVDDEPPLELLELEDLPPPATADGAGGEIGADADANADAGAGADANADAGADDAEETAGRPAFKSIHERLRGLTIAEQLKHAHSADPSERMALERLYGKAVWEALLRNPRLTAPEVARIGRMGTLPRPLIEVILGNAGWLQIPEVRRALLSNPRLGPDQIQRILRLMPKHELKVASTSTAYPHAVRDAAKRMSRDGG